MLGRRTGDKAPNPYDVVFLREESAYHMTNLRQLSLESHNQIAVSGWLQQEPAAYFFLIVGMFTEYTNLSLQ